MLVDADSGASSILRHYGASAVSANWWDSAPSVPSGGKRRACSPA